MLPYPSALMMSCGGWFGGTAAAKDFFQIDNARRFVCFELRNG